MAEDGVQCCWCNQRKPRADFTSSQLKKNSSNRTCTVCSNIDWTLGEDPDNTGSKRCYYCGKYKSNSSYSVNQRNKAKMGLGSCYECVEKGLWYGRNGEYDDIADTPKLCGACGNWKEPGAFSKGQSTRNINDTQRCTDCVHAGRECLDRFKRHDVDSRSLRPLVQPRSKSRSAASSSSSTPPAKRRRKKGKSKPRKRRSSSSSSSSSSVVVCTKAESAKGRPDPASNVHAKADTAASAAAAPADAENPEVAAVKKGVLEQLIKMKAIEPREARMKEFRHLLRQWHPDKNPERKLVATTVFQFLQKGKPLID